MRNKWFIAAAALVALLLLVGVVLLFILGGTDAEQSQEDGGVFGDTSGERPFDGYESTTGELTPNDIKIVYGEAAAQLRPLTNVPVAGMVVVERMVGEMLEPFVRFTESENGHVSDVSLVRTSEPELLSVTTVPRVQEALWSHTGSSTVYRYLDADGRWIYSYVASLSLSSATDQGEASGAPYALTGEVLAADAGTVVFSPSGTSFFYIIDVPGGSAGFIQSVVTGATRKVWSSPMRDVTATWNTEGTILVYTRPSAGVEGFAWLIDVRTEATSLILSGLDALTAHTDTTGTAVLFAPVEQSLLSLRVLNRTTSAINYLDVVTLPEKCIWSTKTATILYCAVPAVQPQSKHYPDEWYQGKIRYNDAFWRVDTVTGETLLLAEPEKLVKATIDAVDLQLDSTERFLIFRDRTSGIPWALQLPAEGHVQESAVPQTEEEYL